MTARNPDQPLITDPQGTLRFKENRIVRYVLDNGGIDLNHIARQDFDQDDRQQFAQLIGYSLSGYSELSFVSDEAYERAAAQAASQAPWTGEGLPPVGTVCEFNGGVFAPEDPWDPDLRVGDQVTIIAHFDGGNGDILAAFTFRARNPDRGQFYVEQGRWGCFRPLRTPEQIAAEEREKAIDEMAETARKATGFGTNLADMEALYDAGYRKQVAP